MKLTINNKDFNEDMIVVSEKTFRQLIAQLPNLNLNSLEQVIVPNDFGKELIEFQRRHRLREGYTNDGTGIAMGKVLTYLDDEEYKASMRA